MLNLPEPEWWRIHDNICMTADYLVTAEGYSATNLLHFIEKPWHYADEYEKAKAENDREFQAAHQDAPSVTV